MGPLDIAMKTALREAPGDLARLVLGGALPASASAEESVMVRVERRMDKLLRLLPSPGEPVTWTHFELLARWEADVPARTYDYWSLGFRDHSPLRSVVLVLRPGEKQGQPRGEYAVHVDGVEVLRFRFTVIRVWEDLTAQGLLAMNAPGLLLLVPFAQGATPALAEEALRRLDAVEPRERRVELQAALLVLAREAFNDERWLDRMPEEQLMNTTTLREITAEAERKGRVEGLTQGRREVLLRQLRLKFGQALSPDLEARIAQAEPAHIDRWLDRVLTASSLEDVLL